MIGGQLHNEGSGVAGEHLGLFQHDAGDDDGGHADEVSGGGHPCAAAEQSTGDHGDKGNLCAAGDEGSGHDGHPAVALVFNGTGGHDTGHAAAGADQHGDEGLAGQAELTEHTVQNEGDTGHVAAGLQEGQHQKQNQHLRDEAKHSANAGHDAVQDQAGQPVSNVCLLQQVADQHGDTGHPHAKISGVRLGAVGIQSSLDRRIVGSLRGNLQGLFIFQLVVDGRISRNGSTQGVNCLSGSLFAVILALGVQRLSHCVIAVLGNQRVNDLVGVAVGFGSLFVVAGANAQQMPAVAEHAVVGPVGSGSANAHHCDPVDQEHHNGEDG